MEQSIIRSPSDKIPAFGLTLQPPNPPSLSALDLLSERIAQEADSDIVSTPPTLFLLQGGENVLGKGGSVLG